jgi:hypothetical protein
MVDDVPRLVIEKRREAVILHANSEVHQVGSPELVGPGRFFLTGLYAIIPIMLDVMGGTRKWNAWTFGDCAYDPTLEPLVGESARLSSPKAA